MFYQLEVVVQTVDVHVLVGKHVLVTSGTQGCRQLILHRERGRIDFRRAVACRHLLRDGMRPLGHRGGIPGAPEVVAGGSNEVVRDGRRRMGRRPGHGRVVQPIADCRDSCRVEVCQLRREAGEHVGQPGEG